MKILEEYHLDAIVARTLIPTGKLAEIECVKFTGSLNGQHFVCFGRSGPVRCELTPREYTKKYPRNHKDGTPITDEMEFDLCHAAEIIINDINLYLKESSGKFHIEYADAVEFANVASPALWGKVDLFNSLDGGLFLWKTAHENLVYKENVWTFVRLVPDDEEAVEFCKQFNSLPCLCCKRDT